MTQPGTCHRVNESRDSNSTAARQAIQLDVMLFFPIILGTLARFALNYYEAWPLCIILHLLATLQASQRLGTQSPQVAICSFTMQVDLPGLTILASSAVFLAVLACSLWLGLHLLVDLCRT